MKKSMLLLGVALSIGLASSCFAQDTAAAKPAAQPQSVKTIFSYKTEIGLTDVQEKDLKALLYDEESLMKTNNGKLKILGKDLGDLIKNKDDMQIIRTKLQEIAKVQVDTSCFNIENARKVEKILTPEQLEKWRDIQKSFYAQAKS
ncbi:MAG: hypothetical protein HQL13_03085 [Candidatus Omnitrophica bacterium]|nr:hypothetical protein [Candidatus Omnitrophota bacterium]